MSNMGLWKDMMQARSKAYGPTLTYKMGAEFLAGMPLIEDWGCGRGYFRKLVQPGRYRGIDGTAGPLVDEVVDLVTYRSAVPAIFMRHVIEHNYEWKTILANALSSFEQRFCLILFTPFTDGPTTNIAKRPFLKVVPDLSFNREEFRAAIQGVHASITTVETPRSQYGIEHVIKMTREQGA